MKLRTIAVLTLMLVVVMGSATISSAQSSSTTHTVQPGETLFSISRQYGVTVQAIAFANGITNPDRIFVGEVLTIPGVAAPTPTPGQTPAPGSTTTYTVVSGDTLFSIARRNGTDVPTLKALNGLANENVLFVGQVLKIPVTSSAPTAAPTAAPTSGPTMTPGGPTATPGATNTPAPTATTAPATNVTYVVQTGDTLTSIALRFNTTYQEIALLNGLTNPNLIFVGQTLIIRNGTVASTATPTAAPTTAPTAMPTSAPTMTPGGPTATPTAGATTVIIPTATGTLATVTPTVANATLPPGFLTPTPLVSGTQVPVDATNRLQNPGFEADTHVAGDPTVKVVNGWEPFYCDKPYTADVCPAQRIGSGNQAGMLMARPAYDKTTTTIRVHGGSAAQMWNCAYVTCRGGVYQTVDTTPGTTCEAGAYVQSWSTNDPTSFTSQLLSADDRANSTWSIRVDPAGGTEAFQTGLLSSPGFTYDNGIYDKYVLISYTFPVNSTQVTVFYEDARLWPYAINSSFIDDAYLRCTG